MNSTLRFGTALSVIAIAGAVAGCSTGGRKATASAAAATPSKVGLATRAQLALSAGKFAAAIPLAEQAVQASPGQPLFRALLGHAYFGAGRFASAEAAYRDSLRLNSAQPKVILKLALAAIAQGRDGEALAALEAARDYLDPADYGLALALARRPADAVAVLDQAARLPGADSRTRQNLALAHALAGDWDMARTIAAQDVAPEQLDERIRQWMAMATPARASDQVAALTGVTPVYDPGQPVHLALNKAAPQPQRLAQAAPPPVAAPPAPVYQAQAQAEVAPRYLQPLPQPMAVPAPPAPEPVVETAMVEDAPASPAPLVQAFASAEREAAPVLAAAPTRFEAKPKLPKLLAAARKPALATGRSGSVVQLGAYGSPQRVAQAWDSLARRYSALGAYQPVSMRFESANGTVYRLSVKGFDSAGEAQGLCASLKGKGASCFVRRVASDAPVQLAGR